MLVNAILTVKRPVIKDKPKRRCAAAIFSSRAVLVGPEIVDRKQGKAGTVSGQKTNLPDLFLIETLWAPQYRLGAPCQVVREPPTR